MDARYIAVIKRFEGFSSRAKWDHGQYSIGFGTKARFSGEVIDAREAEARFGAEIARAEAAVEKFAGHADEGMKAALTSLTYNAGTGWMKDGLGSAVERGDPQAVARLFTQYTKADGETLPGLVTRRLEELTWMVPGAAPVGNLPEGQPPPNQVETSGRVSAKDDVDQPLRVASPGVARELLPAAQGHDASSGRQTAVVFEQLRTEYWRFIAATVSREDRSQNDHVLGPVNDSSQTHLDRRDLDQDGGVEAQTT